MSSIMRRRSGLISAIGGLPFQGWGEAPKPWQTARPEPSATAERTSRVSGLVQSAFCGARLVQRRLLHSGLTPVAATATQSH
jgi:hypothetical protein